MRFEFMTATRIIFGAGALNETGALAATFGKRALVVVGGRADRAARLLQNLLAAGVSHHVQSIEGEPTIELAKNGADAARRENCDLIIGFGGGSALDSAKAIAALATNTGDPLDYLEVIGKNQPLTQTPLPFIAIPTTAGTGSEVTRNAVLASAEHRVKVSLRHPLMLARVALVDPELTHSLPKDVTASTGMDALTQVIEPFVSNAANPLTDAICREGMTRAARSLRAAYEKGENAHAREEMAVASLFGGLALANARLGVVHGFAGPLGGMYPIPHGIACASLLPHVMAVNVRALRQREPDGDKIRRYDEVARILTKSFTARAEDGVQWVSDLCATLGIPHLSTFGILPDHHAGIVEKAMNASSTRGNPIVLTRDEMTEILTLAG